MATAWQQRDNRKLKIDSKSSNLNYFNYIYRRDHEGDSQAIVCNNIAKD